jgi:hypothetical protein
VSAEADEIAAAVHPSAFRAELEAMQTIGEGLDQLDLRARRRALDWAASRYKTAEIDSAGLMKWMNSVLFAIAAHQKATKQPRQIDRELWDLTIKGTTYWSEPAVEDK